LIYGNDKRASKTKQANKADAIKQLADRVTKSQRQMYHRDTQPNQDWEWACLKIEVRSNINHPKRPLEHKKEKYQNANQFSRHPPRYLNPDKTETTKRDEEKHQSIHNHQKKILEIKSSITTLQEKDGFNLSIAVSPVYTHTFLGLEIITVLKEIPFHLS